MVVESESIIRKIEDKYLIINMETGEITTFMGTGDAFFDVLSKSKNMEEAIDMLLMKYDVSKETLQFDVREFVMQMKSLGVFINTNE